MCKNLLLRSHVENVNKTDEGSKQNAAFFSSVFGSLGFSRQGDIYPSVSKLEEGNAASQGQWHLGSCKRSHAAFQGNSACEPPTRVTGSSLGNTKHTLLLITMSSPAWPLDIECRSIKVGKTELDLAWASWGEWPCLIYICIPNSVPEICQTLDTKCMFKDETVME